MPLFSYQALTADATSVSGTIVAETPRQARDTLRAQGLSVNRMEPRRGSFTLMGRPGSAAHLTSFLRELSTLLGVGIPLLQAIDSVGRQYRGAFGTALLAVRDQVASGASLAEAMSRQPLFFDELTTSIVEVGENAGTLETVLERLAEFRERAASVRSRIGTAMLYPLMVLIMAIAVSIFLMTFVVPKLLGGLLEAGRPIPWPTRIVKGASDLLISWWPVLIVGLIVIGLGIVAAMSSAKGRMGWHRIQLRLPLVGGLVRRQAIARVATVISTLMKSGVTFVRALQIAQRTTENLVLRVALRRCEAATVAGQDIDRALEETGAFPPLVIQIFAVGQQSGRLEEMLERLAAEYDRQVTLTTQRLTALLEPLTILVLVFVVGLIVFATILPVLEAADVL